MGNSFPGLCSFKLEQNVECLNLLENVVSFHFPYLTLISVLLLTEVSFRYQAEGRSEASPSAVTRHGAMQWTDKYGRLHYCPLPHWSGVHWPASVSVSTLCSFRISCLGWAGWAGLGWAAQISVCHFYQGRHLRPPPNLRPSFDTREDIFNKRLLTPSPDPHSYITSHVPGELGLLYREVRLLRHRHSGARLHLRPDALLAAAVLHLQSRH